MKKTVLILGFLLLSVSFLLAAGGTEKSGQVKELVMWCAYSQPERIQVMDAAIAKYQSLHPDIKITRELVPWGNIRQKWIAAKMAKTLPQMVVGGDADLIPLWVAGDLEPVDDVVKMLGGPAAFLPGPLQGLNIDGKQIAMPHYTLSWKLVVRKDWLDELGMGIPKTWDEFAKAAIAMTNPPNRYGFDLPLSKTAHKSKEWLAYFMRTNNAYYFDKNGKVVFDSPEVIETVQFLVDVYKKTGRQAAINYTENDCIDNFVKGNVGFIFAAGTVVTSAATTNPEILKKMAIIDTPMKSSKPVDGAGLVGIGKFKGVKYSQETSEFLAYLIKEQDVYRNFLLSMPNQIPITVAGSQDTLFWNDPKVAPYADLYNKWMTGAMTGSRVGMDFGPTPIANSGITGSEIEDMFQSILVDGVSVEKAVKSTADKIRANLKAAGY